MKRKEFCMKRKMKKLTALMLTAAMLAGTMTGCGSKSDSKGETHTSVDENGVIDTSEHVDLTMYLIGEPIEDFDMMWDEVNKYLDEKYNCTVQPEWLSWGEHTNKYSLLFSGNEDFDLIFTATSWGHYNEMLPLNAFYPLEEDFIKTYGPDLMDAVPEEAWDQVRSNGIPYMVPHNNKEYQQEAIAVRGDLMEKYGFDDIATMDEYNAFCEACAADGIYGNNGGAGSYYLEFRSRGFATTGGTPKGGEFLLYNKDDVNDLDFYYIFDEPWFTDFCKEMKSQADAGVWTPDILNSTAERQEGLLNGTCATLLWNIGSCATYGNQANASHPEWNIKVVDPLRDEPKQLTPYSNAGMAINNNSKNPERAMMVINALYTDRYLQELTRLGIEGTHWEAVGDDQYTLLKDTLGVDTYCDWGWTNEKLMRTEYIPEESKTSVDKDEERLIAEFDEKAATPHPYDSFAFDPSNVATEFAAVGAAYENYYAPLVNGLVEDPEATIAELKKALDDAGMQDIIAEVKRQAEEYIASK